MKTMIIRITEQEYAKALAEIFNSSVLRFPEEERGTAEPDTFISQIKNDINLVHMNEQGVLDAFISYHRHGEEVYELTSLYVALNSQKKGMGTELLHYVENELEQNAVVFVKALKNAPWSIQFYEKKGYTVLDDTVAAMAEKFSIREKPWSMILHKKVV